MADKNVPLSIVLKTVDNATGPFSKALDKINKKMASVGKTLTASITLPVVAGFGLATRAMMQFEKGMASVSTLIDTSTESLDDMGKTVLAISRRTPVALEDLTGALFEARSAGVSASDQFKVLEQSARLAVAGLGTTNEAIDLVTSALNAFKPTGEDAAKLYDTIFKATAFGKMTIAGLSRGFGSVAGTVAASNIKLDEYLASVAALTTTGLPAAEAHTQLRAVIAGLTRTTDKSRIVFRKLGAKDFKDLIAKSGGLVPALTRISKLLKGDSSMMLDLFGSTEALNAVLGLTGGQADVFNRALKDMREGGNAVDTAFEKQNKTMSARMTRTKNAMEGLGVKVGTILTPVLEKLADKLSSVIDWFEKLSPETKEWLVEVAGIAAVVGPALIALGKLTTAVEVLTGAWAALNKESAIAGAAKAPKGPMFMGPGAFLRGLPEITDEDRVGIMDKMFARAGQPSTADRQAAIDMVKGFKGRIMQSIAEANLGPSRNLAPFNPRGSVFDAQPAAPAAQPTAHVVLEIKGAPPGSRATINPKSTVDVDLTVGHQLLWFP